VASEQGFRELVRSIISRHPDGHLAERWDEATSSDPNPTPVAFWTRESIDLVNIVWLTDRDIRDITWLPARALSTLHVFRLPMITSVEIRQARQAANSLGLPVVGDFVIIVHSPSQRGGVIWVAENDDESVNKLRSFVGRVIEKMG
jgi:hypothetical protein